MVINSVYAKGFYSYLHEAIYGALDHTKFLASELGNPTESLKERVNLSTTHEYTLKRAYRVSLIHSYYQKFLVALEERGCDLDLIYENIPKLVGCPPEGVFFEEMPTQSYGYWCKRYAVCPWCRFRKANEIAEKILPLLSNAKYLAVLPQSELENFFV